MLFKNLVRATVEESLHAHFPEMTVRKGSGGDSEECAGTGFLHQKRGEGSRVCMYTSCGALDMLLPNSQVGREVHAYELCRVEGADPSGLIWVFRHVLPHIVPAGPTRLGVVEFTPLLIDVCERESVENRCLECEIVFAPEWKPPWQSIGHRIDTMSGDREARSGIAGVDVREGGVHIYGIESPQELAFELRFDRLADPEAAGFALANALTWCLGQHVHWSAIVCGRTAMLQPRPKGQAARSWWTPLPRRHLFFHRADWWTLLALTFRRLLYQPDYLSRVIARVARQVVSASRAGPEAEAVALVFGVEELVQQIGPAERAPLPSHATEVIARWKSELGADNRFTGELRKRIADLLGQLNAPLGPKQLLDALEADGVVGIGHAMAWKKLRNELAHTRPGKLRSLSDSEWMALVEPVATCFNRLVFHAVGYRGAFTDFGTVGYPIARFPAS